VQKYGDKSVLIYAVADIHGKPERLELIENMICEFKPDILVVAGDLTHVSGAVSVIENLNQLPVPVLAVRGNTDLPKVDRLLNHYPNTSTLHLKKERRMEVDFAGVGGTVLLPFHSRIGFFEKRITKRLGRLVDENTVLVAHPPPWGVLDTAFKRFHAGSKCIRRFISTHHPKLLVCGHIHECPGTMTFGKTRIVNCNMAKSNAGALIELGDNSRSAVKMLQKPSGF
jgi:Icc-related predicted phosphoesterase